jgi:hypothetical protein
MALLQQIGEQAQQRVADAGFVGTAAFTGITFTVTGVLQFIALILAVSCGAFSLYFHIQRFRKERREKKP